MKNITLRQLTPDEWPLLQKMRIHSATLHPDLFYDTPETAAAKPDSHWQNLLARTENRFWGLFDQDKCIGITGIVTVETDPSGQTAMIGYSFIEPNYRGQGLADMLYKARLDYAHTYKGWNKIITDHRDGNEASQKLILKHGFNFTGKELIDWPDGSRDYECRYELKL